MSAQNGKYYGYRTPGKGKATTAAGHLCMMYMGQKKDDPGLLKGAEQLDQWGPDHGNLYYTYYATQVMFHRGGDSWKTWHEHLHPLLIGSQQRRGPMRGSWHPLAPVPDKWGAYGGRIYVTTMNLLSLEVHYRHLPLYGQMKAESP